MRANAIYLLEYYLDKNLGKQLLPLLDCDFFKVKGMTSVKSYKSLEKYMEEQIIHYMNSKDTWLSLCAIFIAKKNYGSQFIKKRLEEKCIKEENPIKKAASKVVLWNL